MRRQVLEIAENIIAIEIIEGGVQSITIQKIIQESGDRILLYWDVKGEGEHQEFTTMNMLKKIGDK